MMDGRLADRGELKSIPASAPMAPRQAVGAHRTLWVSTPLPYSWSRSRPARLNSVSVLRRSFGTSLAARAGDRSHRRLPGSRVAPALRSTPSRWDGQWIATNAPSSTSWHGPIWCGRSAMNTPDGFRRQPAGRESQTPVSPADRASMLRPRYPGDPPRLTPPIARLTLDKHAGFSFCSGSFPLGMVSIRPVTANSARRTPCALSRTFARTFTRKSPEQAPDHGWRMAHLRPGRRTVRLVG